MASSLWNIGNKESPIIQGQAGKPFYHQAGPYIQFEDDPEIINNSCLCKNKAYQYWVYYACINQESNIPFYKYTEGESYKHKDVPQEYEGQWSRGVPDMQTQLRSGYKFQLQGASYAGCFEKGHFGECGKWKPLDLPYDETDRDNYTSPSPYYIYNRAPFGKSTAVKMYVNSHICCGGTKGCGIEVSSDDPFLDLQGDYCQASFTVYHVKEYDKQGMQVPPVAVMEEGSSRCGKGHQRSTLKFLNCHTAKVRVYSAYIPDDTSEPCEECKQGLYQLAVSTAQQDTSLCYQWVLWVQLIDCCEEGPYNNWVNASSLEGSQAADIPSDIVGPGWGTNRETAHTEGLVLRCRQEGHYNAFYWQKLNIQAQIPQSLDHPVSVCPCEKSCTDTSEPLGGSLSNSQDPFPVPTCNIPDPPGERYEEIHKAHFDIYTVTVHSNSQQQQEDLCQDLYYIQLNEDSQIDWNLAESNLQDCEVVQYDGQWLKISQSSISYLVNSKGEPQTDPSQFVQAMRNSIKSQYKNAYIQDNRIYFSKTQNRCPQYWQLDFKCVQNSPLCRARSLGHYSDTVWEEVQADRGVCMQKWQVSTYNNTFTPQNRSLPGDFVYTIKTQWHIEQLCISKSGGSYTVQAKSSYSDVTPQTYTVELPRMGTNIKVKTFSLQCPEGGAQPAVGSSSWENIQWVKNPWDQELSGQDWKNEFCMKQTFQGWWQPADIPQHCITQELLQGSSYRMFPGLGYLMPAKRDPDTNKIAPGRMLLYDNCEETSQGACSTNPICDVYYIHYIDKDWDPVWEDTQEEGLVTYCNRKIYNEAQSDSFSLSSVPQMDFEQDCFSSKYGVRVWFLGYSVWAGMAFQASPNPSNPSQTLYWLSKSPTYEYLAQSQECFQELYGTGAPSSGFYENSGLSGDFVYDPDNGWASLGTAYSPSSGSWNTWTISNCQSCEGSSKAHLKGRIYVQTGWVNPCDSRVQMSFPGFNGQNAQVDFWAGVKIPLKVYTSAPWEYGPYPAWAYDGCVSPACDSSWWNQQGTVFKRMQKNGQLQRNITLAGNPLCGAPEYDFSFLKANTLNVPYKKIQGSSYIDTSAVPVTPFGRIVSVNGKTSTEGGTTVTLVPSMSAGYTWMRCNSGTVNLSAVAWGKGEYASGDIWWMFNELYINDGSLNHRLFSMPAYNPYKFQSNGHVFSQKILADSTVSGCGDKGDGVNLTVPAFGSLPRDIKDAVKYEILDSYTYPVQVYVPSYLHTGSYDGYDAYVSLGRGQLVQQHTQWGLINTEIWRTDGGVTTYDSGFQRGVADVVRDSQNPNTVIGQRTVLQGNFYPGTCSVSGAPTEPCDTPWSSAGYCYADYSTGSETFGGISYGLRKPSSTKPTDRSYADCNGWDLVPFIYIDSIPLVKYVTGSHPAAPYFEIVCGSNIECDRRYILDLPLPLKGQTRDITFGQNNYTWEDRKEPECQCYDDQTDTWKPCSQVPSCGWQQWYPGYCYAIQASWTATWRMAAAPTTWFGLS